MAARAFPVRGATDTCRLMLGMLCAACLKLAKPSHAPYRPDQLQVLQGYPIVILQDTQGPPACLQEIYWSILDLFGRDREPGHFPDDPSWWVADTSDSGLVPFLTQIQQCELAAYLKTRPRKW